MKRAMLILCLAIITTGCSTIVRGSRQDVEVKTNPAGLLARINTQQCITPCTLQKVSRTSATHITLVHAGRERAFPLDRSFNFFTTIVGNIWNYGIGISIDAASGAMHNIEDINLDLDLASSNITGSWQGPYNSSKAGSRTASMNLMQTGTAVTGTYANSMGARGNITGLVAGNTVNFNIAVTTPGCTGSFDGVGAIGDGSMAFSYNGEANAACGGTENGTGNLAKQ